MTFRYLIQVVIPVACVATSEPLAAQFPVAGGDAQRSGFVDLQGPVTEPKVHWETGLGVRGISDTQPILDAQGNLYVTGCPIHYRLWQSSETPKGAFVSLDSHGNERWRYEWTWDPTRPRYHHTWSQLTGPVLVKENLVVMGSRFGMLRCWNRNTGELRWDRRLTAGNNPVTSTPVADQAGFLYIHVRDIPNIRKVDVATGEYIWIHRFADGSGGTTSSPSLSHDEKTLYIGRTARGNAYLYAVNTDVGSYKWAWSPEVGRGHAFAWSIPVIDNDGNIYIQDEENANFYAVRDLGRIHSRQFVVKHGQKGAPRLAATNDRFVFSSYSIQEHPVVAAIDRSGKEQWSHEFDEKGEVSGLLATRNAVYFAINIAGHVCALDARTGEPLWSKQVGPSGASFSEGLTLSPDGVLYVGIDGTEQHPDEATIIALEGNRKLPGADSK